MSRSLKIGYVLAGRQNAQRSGLAKLLARPFSAPLVLRTLAAMVTEVAPEVEHCGWDELLRGEVGPKFMQDVDVVFLSGLSTGMFGMQRVAKLAHSFHLPVVAGGMGVTCHYYADPKRNLPELLEHFDSVCIGRATSRIIREIIEDQGRGELKPFYQELPGEKCEFVVPRHDLFRGRYWFNNVIQTSGGCSSDCNFCAIHRNLPGGIRKRIYPVPKEKLKPQFEEFVTYGGPIFDASDSFGEHRRHTREVVLPLYEYFGLPWMAEGKLKVLKGTGDWQLLKDMAKAGSMAVYAGFEDLFHQFTDKQVDIADAEEFIHICRGEGIVPIGSLMVGTAPEATKVDIDRMIDWVKKRRVDTQFSLISVIESVDLWWEALADHTLVDVNPEHTDGAWPQRQHPNLGQEFLIQALARSYRECYSLREIYHRFRARGFSRRSLFAAMAGLGVHVSAERWFRHHNYCTWLETRILPYPSH